jgi:F1F0 ATPase subunit 2
MLEFIIGIILGILFFGGLYLTVGKLNEVKNPSFLVIFSFIIRMVILLGGLFYLSKKGYQAILLALMGIVLVKFIMIFMVNKPSEKATKRGD